MSYLNFNDWAYHSLEVLLCDVKLAFLTTRRNLRLSRIEKLEAELAKRRAK